MNLILRAAKMDDAQRLFDWRNDPSTRENSRGTSPMSWLDHIGWVSASLARADRELLIAENNGEPVGTVRLDLTNDMCELSWTIAHVHRNRGYGQEMVRLAMLRAPANILIAEIRFSNEASSRIAHKLGFVEASRRDDFVIWKYSR